MRRRRKDTGITIAYSKNAKKRVSLGYQIMDLLMDTVFYMLLIYGCVVGNFVACGAPVHIRSSMLVTLILLFITQVVLEKRFRKRLIVGIYIFAMLALLMIYAKGIIEGAIYFASYYCEYINSYYNTNLVVTIEGLELEVSYALTYFQIFLAWILLFISIVFRKIYKKPLVALILAILYFSLYFVVGLIPEAKYLFSFLIGFLPLWIYGKGDDAELGVQTKATTLAGVGVLAILCTVVLPERLYQERLPDIYSKKNEIRSLAEEDLISSLKYYFSGITEGAGVFGIKGGLDDGELGNKDELVFDKKTDFILTTSAGEKNFYGDEYELYLRSYIGSNYTNKLWGDLDEEQQEAYKELTEKYNFDFENQLTSSVDVYDQYCFGEGDPPEEVTETVTIEKRDIGKKQTLLPYGVIDNVYIKNGNIYSDETYQKRKYSVKMHSDALVKNLNLDEEWFDELPIITKASTCSYLYDRGESMGYDTTKMFIEDETGFHKTAGGSRELFEPYYERELEYRKFVYNNYTRVPEGIAPMLTEKVNKVLYAEYEDLVDDFGGYWFSPYEPDFEKGYSGCSFSNYLWWCTESLKESAKYSLAPGKVPEGEDLIDYFLFTNQKGYCSYYATAATVFLRLCGIPTRYVEGYKIVSKDFSKHGKKIRKDGKDCYTLNVTDEYAHAWIEVYVDGCGWLPYDVTPARGDFIEGVDKDNADRANQNQNSNQPAVSPSTKPSTVPSKQPVSMKPVETGSKGAGYKSGDSLGYREFSEVQKLLLFTITMLVAVVVAVVVRHSILVKKKRKQRGKKNNDRVKFYYKELDGMIRAKKKDLKSSDEIRDYVERYADEFGVFTKEEMYRVISIVEKATFGASEISDYECAKVQLLYDSMKNYMYKNSSLIKTIYYRIWKAF